MSNSGDINITTGPGESFVASGVNIGHGGRITGRGSDRAGRCGECGGSTGPGRITVNGVRLCPACAGGGGESGRTRTRTRMGERLRKWAAGR